MRVRCFVPLVFSFVLFAIPAAAQTLTPPGAAAGQNSQLFGELRLGPHPVGFRVIEIRDSSRPVRKKRDYFGELDRSDRARVVQVHLWYPARRCKDAPMTVADYLDSSAATGADRLAFREEKRIFIQDNFGTFSDADWDRFLSTTLLACRGAAATGEKFPLVLGQIRAFSTTLTNEYLASHGYVVAMVRGPYSLFAPRGLFYEEVVRDLEFAYEYLKPQPYVDWERLAVLGFSGAGFGQVLFAMRHPDVDALVDLESALFVRSLGLNQGLGYDVTGLRVPFLHAYSVKLSKLDDMFDEFLKMKYSARFHYLVDVPEIHHWDFATEGMAASTVLNLRGAAQPRLRKAFELTNRYVLNFLDAYLKKDPEGLAFLRREPAVNGAPPGMVAVKEYPALKAPPTLEEFQRIFDVRGSEIALQVFREARQREPGAALFNRMAVNRWGYTLLNRNRVREAIEVLKLNVEMYPNTSNPYDSLAEAYERAGQFALAVEITQNGLAVIAEEKDLSEDFRKQLTEEMQKRLARLQR